MRRGTLRTRCQTATATPPCARSASTTRRWRSPANGSAWAAPRRSSRCSPARSRSPLLYRGADWGFLGSLLGTIASVVIFRGLIDVLAHRFIPAPTLYGAEDELKDEDVVSRRRVYYWRRKFRLVWRLFVLFAICVGVAMIYNAFSGGDSSVVGRHLDSIGDLFTALGPAMAVQLPFIFILFFANFLILFGPLLLLGAGQIKGYEPGDADWGVKLADVRGQAEAKEEITRVVSLWQSGEAFEKAGGKRERGVLFLGAPGHRQDDALQGHRDLVQLPVRLDPGLRLRPDLHRHGRGARPLPGHEGQAPRPQVGRPVHRLHRRDRRRRHAPPGARLGLPAVRDRARSTTRCSTGPTAR